MKQQPMFETAPGSLLNSSCTSKSASGEGADVKLSVGFEGLPALPRPDSYHLHQLSNTQRNLYQMKDTPCEAHHHHHT